MHRRITQLVPMVNLLLSEAAVVLNKNVRCIALAVIVPAYQPLFQSVSKYWFHFSFSLHRRDCDSRETQRGDDIEMHNFTFDFSASRLFLAKKRLLNWNYSLNLNSDVTIRAVLSHDDLNWKDSRSIYVYQSMSFSFAPEDLLYYNCSNATIKRELERMKRA